MRKQHIYIECKKRFDVTPKTVSIIRGDNEYRLLLKATENLTEKDTLTEVYRLHMNKKDVVESWKKGREWNTITRIGGFTAYLNLVGFYNIYIEDFDKGMNRWFEFKKKDRKRLAKFFEPEWRKML